MHALRTLLRALFSFTIIWVVSAVSLWLTSQLIPGVDLIPVGEHTVWTTAVAAAFILGVSNLIIRPLLLLLAVPLGFIALFIVGFFVNAVVLRLTANILSRLSSSPTGSAPFWAASSCPSSSGLSQPC